MDKSKSTPSTEQMQKVPGKPPRPRVTKTVMQWDQVTCHVEHPGTDIMVQVDGQQIVIRLTQGPNLIDRRSRSKNRYDEHVIYLPESVTAGRLITEEYEYEEEDED
jgi:hypothetical protein